MIRLLVHLAVGGGLAAYVARAAVEQKTNSVPAPTTEIPAAPVPSYPAPIPGVVPPAKAYSNAVALGAGKAAMPSWKILLMGVLGGVYIAFGGFLAMSIGGNCPGVAASNPGLQKMVLGAFGLPFGLLMVLVAGAELFTGNTALVTCAAYEKKASLQQLAKSWLVSFAGNLLGSLLMVLLVAQTGLLAGAAGPIKLAVAKTSSTWVQAFVKGILCNWLVCIAIWQASAATTLPGKAVGVWFPISAFVALGLEHSVANMFLVPMGIACGASVSFGKFLVANLVPVTLGNIVGGALCVATAYSLCFGALGKPSEA